MAGTCTKGDASATRGAQHEGKVAAVAEGVDGGRELAHVDHSQLGQVTEMSSAFRTEFS